MAAADLRPADGSSPEESELNAAMVLSFLQMHFNRLTGGLVPPPRNYGTAPEGGWNVLLILSLIHI